MLPRSLAMAALAAASISCGTGPDTGKFAFDFYVYGYEPLQEGQRGAPVSGALVALDLAPGERQQLVTGEDGRARFLVPNDVADVTITAAKPGWLPVQTIYRATLPELAARGAARKLYVVMAPPQVRSGNTVTLTLTSATPRFCVSAEPAEACTEVGWTTAQLPMSGGPLQLVAQALDEQGCPAELLELTLPDAMTDRAVELVFDGTGRTDARRIDLSVRLPADRASTLRAMGTYTFARFPLRAFDEDWTAIQGGACNESPRADGMTIDLTAAWFEPVGKGCVFDLAVFPNFYGPHDRATMEFSWLGLATEPAPGAMFDVLDIPRVQATPPGMMTLSSVFASQEVAFATDYQAVLIDPAQSDRLLWMVHSFRHQSLALPAALPDGYDTTVEWPPEAFATFRMQACDGPATWATPWPPVPGLRCAVSAPLRVELMR